MIRTCKESPRAKKRDVNRDCLKNHPKKEDNTIAYQSPSTAQAVRKWCTGQCTEESAGRQD